MDLTIIGAGYVGLVTGACLAELGNHVFCLDVDINKINILNAGGSFIYEPGLKDIIQRNVSAGRLTFSSDVAAGVSFGRIQFIAAGTPSEEDGGAELEHVLSAARSIGRHMSDPKVVVNKSTVPVGTADRITAAISAELSQRGIPDLGFSTISNPEFLREGDAVEDFMHPDRIVIGASTDKPGQQALALMRQLYAPFNRYHERMCVMGVRSAELTKYAANAMLATRISFMNELANLADRVGADIEQVRQGIGSDSRIGFGFLYAGAGYGGGCLPKDLRALTHDAREYGQVLRILEAVETVNNDQKHVLADKVFAHFGPDIQDKIFAVWGLAFKPDTDDMRDAPSCAVIGSLLRAGAHIQAHDPVAMHVARRVLQLYLADTPYLVERISYADSPMDAVQGADALIIMTEWKVYRSPDFAALKVALQKPVVFDGRNLYDPQQLKAQGFSYYGIGRGSK